LGFSVLCCSITIYVTMQDRFSTFQYRCGMHSTAFTAFHTLFDPSVDLRCRGLRAGTFIGSGMSGIFPVVHMVYIGLDGNWISAQYILLMGFL
jgi:hypothetical protein